MAKLAYFGVKTPISPIIFYGDNSNTVTASTTSVTGNSKAHEINVQNSVNAEHVNNILSDVDNVPFALRGAKINGDSEYSVPVERVLNYMIRLMWNRT